jgi:hypothetical protein
VTRELAEGKISSDFKRALDLYEKIKEEYSLMLQEHGEILKALDELERLARGANEKEAVEFTRKLRLHARTEEALVYPAVPMAGKLLEQRSPLVGAY